MELDGALLGSTPLVARVRPGHPLLRVSLPGRYEVQERLTVSAADRINRDYELSPAPQSGGLEAPVSRPAAAPEGEAGGAATTGHAAAAPAPVAPHPARVEPIEPTPADAQTLLAEARQHRTARDWARAARAYRALLRRHGRSAEAPAARVALGLLLLDQLKDPRGALALFDAYLAGTLKGPLAQEAAYGRIRALQRLGRRVEEISALRSFLHYYPGALQEPLVQRRLASLEAAGAPSGAMPPEPR